MHGPETLWTRRAVLRGGAVLLGGMTLNRPLWAEEPARRPALRVGMATDIHYADVPARGGRYYRQSLDKLTEAMRQFKRDKPDLVAQLGDLIDKTEDVEQEIGYLRTIERVYAQTPCDRHYVLGNHCIETLTKQEFLDNTGARAPHYAFDAGRFHFVVLDACYRSDGKPYGRNNAEWTDANIPQAQLDWLAADLQKAAKPTIVLAHQRLDDEGSHHVKNAAAVRQILKRSGQVLAVFQGHSHRNDYVQREGIHYCTLVAMVEGSGEQNSGYAMVSLFDDGSIRIEGFRLQQSRTLARP